MSILNKIKPNQVKVNALGYKHLIAGRPKSGKAVDNNALIPTPEGFKKMGEIKEGDFVFDRQGSPTKVLGVFPQGKLKAYKVTLDDGRSFVVNDEHIIPYVTSKGNINNKTLAEMEEDYVYYKESGLDGRGEIKKYRYKIPNNMAVEYPEKDLPIDPYALGVLIGDGALTVQYLAICSDEFDVVDKASKKLGMQTPEKSEYNYNWSFGAEGGKRKDLMNKIADLGLNVKSIHRFIPESYLLGSVNQRLELLRGLLDTDGRVNVSPHGATRFDFSTNSQRLADGVRMLANSLGFGVTVGVVDREEKDNLEYTVAIYTKDISIVTSKKHTKQLEKATKFSKKEEYSMLVDIQELDEEVEMTCIKVDNEEELFLINDYIVTHNTSLFHGIVKKKYNGDMSKGLLIAFEKGYSALKGIHAIDIQTWEDFQELVEELVDNKDEVSYEILALDTIDVLIQRATDYMLHKQSIKDKKRYTAVNDLAYGKGYELLERTIATEIDKLDQAGYNLVFITHDKDKTITQKDGLEYNKTVISAGGRAGEYFKNSADLIHFIEIAKELDKGKKVDKRYIYFRGDGDLEAGSRFPNIVKRVEYSVDNFINAIEDAIRAEYDGDEEKVEEAKKEQVKEAEEAREEEKSQPTAEELIAEVDEKLKGVDNTQKRELAKQLKEEFGAGNYKKFKDTKDLEKVIKMVEAL